MWLITFILRPFYLPRYTLDRRLGGPQPVWTKCCLWYPCTVTAGLKRSEGKYFAFWLGGFVYTGAVHCALSKRNSNCSSCCHVDVLSPALQVLRMCMLSMTPNPRLMTEWGYFSICWPLLCHNDLPYQIIMSVLLMRLIAYIVRILMNLSVPTVTACLDRQYMAWRFPLTSGLV